jgi:hypothetical protein
MLSNFEDRMLQLLSFYNLKPRPSDYNDILTVS